MQENLDPRFKIRAPLRCDGVGSLDCAYDTVSGARMAVRWLPLSANGEAAARAVEKLPHHPVLPRIRQTGTVGQAAYVALDFPEGQLLSTFEGEFAAPARLLTLGAALADALAALHEGGIVHGELSPSSVLCLPEGRAILWDAPLVMANRLTDRRGEERALGLLAHAAPFISPERARGLPPSLAADVFALGATLCAAGGGALPASHSTLAILHRIATGDWTPDIPAQLPPAARALLQRMLSPDPLSRPAAREVAVAFAALIVGEVPSRPLAPPRTATAPAASNLPVPRRGWRVALVVAALAASVAAALLFGPESRAGPSDDVADLIAPLTSP